MSFIYIVFTNILNLMCYSRSLFTLSVIALSYMWNTPVVPFSPGESRWLSYSGHQPGLQPLRPRFNPEVAYGVSFGRSQSGCEGFYPVTPVFLPPQTRLPDNYIWLGLRCFEITHGLNGGRRAAPSHAFYPIPLSRLVLKSPCRERSSEHIYIYNA